MNNNPRFDTSPSSNSPEAIRSEIATTRQRMDDTIDALTSRLKGRHLVDEVLGYVRSSGGNGNGAKIKEKVTDTATTAMHTAMDAVKAHPLPSLLIGAGVAWMIYEKRKPQSTELTLSYDPDYDAQRAAGYGVAWEEDVSYDYTSDDTYLASAELSTSDYPGEALGAGGAEGGKMQKMKNKLSGASSAAGERAAALKERGRAGAQAVGQRVQAGYTATRQRVSATVGSRPVESAIACLALGLIAGLLIPTPRAVAQVAAPTANRLRQRARDAGQDLVARGKHVAEAALEAAREEADAQGVTPSALKSKAASVAEHARDAARDTAQEEGLQPKSKRQDPSPASPAPSASGSQGF